MGECGAVVWGLNLPHIERLFPAMYPPLAGTGLFAHGGPDRLKVFRFDTARFEMSPEAGSAVSPAKE